MRFLFVFSLLVAFTSSKSVFKHSKHGITSDTALEARLEALEIKYGDKLKSQEEKIAALEKQLYVYDGMEFLYV